MSAKRENEEGFLIKLRGLPFSATPEQIQEFLGDCRIQNGSRGVHLVMTGEGRASGRAFVKMDSEDDVEQALQKHRKRMGGRYIEVYRAKASEMEREGNDNGHSRMRSSSRLAEASDDDEAFIVKLRGLPWSSTPEDILPFLGDCKVRGGSNGIHLTTTVEGRPSGEAYVELASNEDVQLALRCHNNRMGHRFIEVYKTHQFKMKSELEKANHPRGDVVMQEACVRLRGLSYECSKEEILHFFSGLEIVPNGIMISTDGQGRNTGEAFIQFVNKDAAEKALRKHKQNIGRRYIEIYRSSLAEAEAALGPKMRPMGGGSSQRPGPYDRGSRGGGSRGSRSLKGFDPDNIWAGSCDMYPEGEYGRGGNDIFPMGEVFANRGGELFGNREFEALYRGDFEGGRGNDGSFRGDMMTGYGGNRDILGRDQFGDGYGNRDMGILGRDQPGYGYGNRDMDILRSDQPGDRYGNREMGILGRDQPGDGYGNRDMGILGRDQPGDRYGNRDMGILGRDQPKDGYGNRDMGILGRDQPGDGYGNRDMGILRRDQPGDRYGNRDMGILGRDQPGNGYGSMSLLDRGGGMNTSSVSGYGNRGAIDEKFEEERGYGSRMMEPGVGFERRGSAESFQVGTSETSGVRARIDAQMVYVRGLPFTATEADIADFFRPLIPRRIRLVYDNGRPTGEADVEFPTREEAVQGITKIMSPYLKKMIAGTSLG